MHMPPQTEIPPAQPTTVPPTASRNVVALIPEKRPIHCMYYVGTLTDLNESLYRERAVGTRCAVCQWQTHKEIGSVRRTPQLLNKEGTTTPHGQSEMITTGIVPAAPMLHNIPASPPSIIYCTCTLYLHSVHTEYSVQSVLYTPYLRYYHRVPASTYSSTDLRLLSWERLAFEFHVFATTHASYCTYLPCMYSARSNRARPCLGTRGKPFRAITSLASCPAATLPFKLKLYEKNTDGRE